MNFADYLDPGVTLEERVGWAFEELKISRESREDIMAFLQPLRVKDRMTYEHSLRLGLLGRRLAEFMYLDGKALLHAGLLHDVGKDQIPLEVLQKTDSWTEADAGQMQGHVLNSFRTLRGKFDFTAGVIVWHHRFQARGYPKKLPRILHNYSEATKTMQAMYGRLLALVDTYDSLHRVNSKYGPLTGEQIKEKMFEYGFDQKGLIKELYDAGIFTTYLVGDGFQTPEVETRNGLYDQIWKDHQPWRTPDETARHVMLAAALEPLSEKNGCTTRHRDASQELKLDFFVAAGINIGDAFRELARRIDTEEAQPKVIYDLALRAQMDSKRNRQGGRVNQGIIELLMPIVAAQHVHDIGRVMTVNEIILKAGEVLKNTSTEDIDQLMAMKRFAYDLCYYDRIVPHYPDAVSVYQYYEHELDASTKQTSIAHNSEFVHEFHTVRIIYETLRDCPIPGLNAKSQEAYQRAAAFHHHDVSSGFLADCVAIGIYLMLSQRPKGKVIS